MSASRYFSYYISSCASMRLQLTIWLAPPNTDRPERSDDGAAMRRKQQGGHTIGRSFRCSLRCGSRVLSDDSTRLFELAALDRERVALPSLLACHKALWMISTFLR